MTSSFEISFIWKKFKIAAFSPFDFSDKIYIYRPGQPNLDFHSAYAFIKKIHIFYPMNMKLGQN